MIQSGIDVKVFKPHSTRAASTSKANSCQVPFDIILQAASWKGDCTFVSFITNPLKVMCLSLAMLFLALVQESRPFYIVLCYVQFSL